MDDKVLLTEDVRLKKCSMRCQTRRIVLCSIVVILLVCGVCLGVFLHDRARGIIDKNQDDREDNFEFVCGIPDENKNWDYCYGLSSSNCNITLIESIPENMTYPKGAPSHPSIFTSWLKLLDAAKSNIYIASSYWSLRSEDVPVKDPSSWQGDAIFNKLVEVGKRGVSIKIVHQVDTKYQTNEDTKVLEEMGLAEVRVLDMKKLLGAGILHTKMWLVDNMHFYLGSANMDWRSLTQVKELGLLTSNCSCLATDMSKIFDIYWFLAENNSHIPDHWPTSLDTNYNKDHPMPLMINGNAGEVYLSSSPPPLCTKDRTTDIDSILDVIHKAQKFIHISVMDYSPTFLYTWPSTYWAVIDDALREAAFDRRIEVHFMASDWLHTKLSMIPFLKSLAVLNDVKYVNVEVRLLKVPANERQEKIPYSRVQHTKYMVTDNAAYIGTSNWSADYFVNTGGIGYILNQTSPDSEKQLFSDAIQRQLEDVFSRDWNSNYTKSIWEY
ncbi:phospholipase D3-like [Dendronephthya gigantea]|uniref:phospholipase D3-like n=1 Tax=Dendronephthya gigantea TaxID=151771 RepID=UPI00106AC220|nr:phospholipase D3-like [Dendronephthya gigantea]